MALAPAPAVCHPPFVRHVGARPFGAPPSRHGRAPSLRGRAAPTPTPLARSYAGADIQANPPRGHSYRTSPLLSRGEYVPPSFKRAPLAQRRCRVRALPNRVEALGLDISIDN